MLFESNPVRDGYRCAGGASYGANPFRRSQTFDDNRLSDCHLACLRRLAADHLEATADVPQSCGAGGVTRKRFLPLQTDSPPRAVRPMMNTIPSRTYSAIGPSMMSSTAPIAAHPPKNRNTTPAAIRTAPLERRPRING